MIGRREFITLLGSAAAAWPLAARAQQAARVPRIGWITIGRPAGSEFFDAFRQGLRQLGYVEGQSITSSRVGQLTSVIACRICCANCWRSMYRLSWPRERSCPSCAEQSIRSGRGRAGE